MRVGRSRPRPTAGLMLAVCSMLLLAGSVGSASPPGDPRAADHPAGQPDEATGQTGDGFLPGAPGVRLLGPEEHDRGVSEEMIVRMAYKSLEVAARRSGADLSFELEDFETIYREAFDRVLWSEIITLAPETELAVARTEVYWDETRQGVTWEPQWEPVISEPGVREEFLDRFAAMTLSELLAFLASEHGKQVDDVVAATRYSVVAEFAGRREAYRAAFFWHATADGGVSLTVEDPVTQRVDEALVTKDRFDTRPKLLEAGRRAAEAPAIGRGEDNR